MINLFLKIVGLAFICFSSMSHAQVLHSQDTKAHKYFDEKNFTKAAVEFKTPSWKGVSWYKSGDYEKAVQYFKQGQDVTSLYNLGNALAKLGQYQEAIDAYDKALKKSPKHEDALYNKELVMQKLSKDDPKSDQNGGDNKKEGDNKKDGNNSKSNSEDDKKDDENKSDQKNEREKNNDKNNDKNEPKDHEENSNEKKDNKSDNQAPQNGNQPEEENEDVNNGPENEDHPKEQPKELPSDKENEDKSQNSPPKETKEINLSQEQEDKWLGRIQDDPGGLLRRKFEYQYLASEYEKDDGEPSW